MLRITQVILPVGHGEEELPAKVAKKLRIPVAAIQKLRIVRQSLDARKKPQLFYSYTVDMQTDRDAKIWKHVQGTGVHGGKADISWIGEAWADDALTSAHPATGARQMDGGYDRRSRPIVVGSGPAGLFCAYTLALAGLRPILLEQGDDVDERIRKVERFWKDGTLDETSNVQFGEGGAGTFSDGKLTTQVKDPHGYGRRVLDTFVAFGANPAITYQQYPHLGTDVLAHIVKNMREEILRLGAEVRFRTQVVDLEITGGAVRAVRVWDAGSAPPNESWLAAGTVVLAVGHSARPLFRTLNRQGISMEAKPFAVGMRIQHPQDMINLAQYGQEDVGALDASIGPAVYKLAAVYHTGIATCWMSATDGATSTERVSATPGLSVAECATSDGSVSGTRKDQGVYTFCMCPGGYVVNASSAAGHLTLNGMSYSDRGGANANSAVVVTVTPDDVAKWTGTVLPDDAAVRTGSCAENVSVAVPCSDKPGASTGRGCIDSCIGRGLPGMDGIPQHPLRMMEFQEQLERKAYELGGGQIPVQLLGDFMDREVSAGFGDVQPGMKGGYRFADLNELWTEELRRAFIYGIKEFGKKIKGFDRRDAILAGVESRTSSPVRILRGGDLQSVSCGGLYPCGEGAGYAGGIMSAAMDGIRVAEGILGKTPL
ncbi:MAG: FAD-binding protein [Lachnospiraceae bacterium]|jgi:uncharacterized FAD-dependent dehydrogenase|nr:FAD-binding protein [Lachnospiraceae bacterium]